MARKCNTTNNQWGHWKAKMAMKKDKSRQAHNKGSLTLIATIVTLLALDLSRESHKTVLNKFKRDKEGAGPSLLNKLTGSSRYSK